MVFDSFEFALFLAIVFPLYLVLSHRGQNRMLLVASYFFYGWWSWKFLLLLMATNVVDFWCGIGLGHYKDPRVRRALVTTTIALNMGALGFFKYFNFFAENLQTVLESVGLHVSLPVLQVVLPFGISFYTFQEMTYAIHVYKGLAPPERNFIDFALFVTFFPQLVAGPIMRPNELLPQIKRPRRVTWQDLRAGGWLIYWGLYKKVFIADNVATIVDRVYDAPGKSSAFEILIATYAFAVQIYCDFSGYSDMARGLGRILGFDIVLNFDLPYFARSPSELWRRWHISLSQFLRDNLYIPLGGNRRGRLREYFNLMATMTLGGLWHGARWNFVLWGMFHGAILAIQRLVKDAAGAFRPPPEERARPGAWRRIRSVLAILGMFHLTCFGWILFRAQSFHDIGTMLGQLVGGPWHASAAATKAGSMLLWMTLPLLVMQVFQFRTGDLMVIRRAPAWLRAAVYVAIYFSLTLGAPLDGRVFIYFQF